MGEILCIEGLKRLLCDVVMCMEERSKKSEDKVQSQLQSKNRLEP